MKAERLLEINTKYFVHYLATMVLSIKQIQKKTVFCHSISLQQKR